MFFVGGCYITSCVSSFLTCFACSQFAGKPELSNGLGEGEAVSLTASELIEMISEFSILCCSKMPLTPLLGCNCSTCTNSDISKPGK